MTNADGISVDIEQRDEKGNREAKSGEEGKSHHLVAVTV
jgi:hypothetical protein